MPKPKKKSWFTFFTFGKKDAKPEYVRKHLFIDTPRDRAFKLTRKTIPKKKEI